MSDVLEEICAKTHLHVAERKSAVSEAQLFEKTKNAEPPRGFVSKLKQARNQSGFGLIAEIKKASPSKGLIRADFDPPKLAEAYRDGGAACLSVLTDEPYFQGRDDFLVTARDSVPLPVLRKDFMVDPYQIIESRSLGADCVLLIMAVLDDQLAADLKQLAEELGMDTLIEVHNAAETARALKLSPSLLGINNRNLKTLSVDLQVTESLAPLAGEDTLLVSESGLYSHEDLQRMAVAGVTCFLAGESLMRQKHVAKATRRLLGLDEVLNKAHV